MIRKNQKGFTLVELIIAVAILAVVTLAVCGFIVVGSRSYTSANTDIMLQQEAQLALNQMSDVIIDTTDSISYNVGTSGGLQSVLKDSEYAGEATDKSLVVVNRKDDTSNNDNPSYWFYWIKDYEKIFFGEIEGINASTTDDEIQSMFDAELSSMDPDNAAVLAEHVTDLNIDISQFEENRVVMISMDLENGNRTYSTSNNVTVRNRIALNTVNIDPMTRREPFTITAKPVTVEPGESVDLTKYVEVDPASAWGDLTWEPTSNKDSSTQVVNGVLKVGMGEGGTDSPNFFVKVTPTDSQYASKAQMLQVRVKRVTKVADEDITAAPGDTIKLDNSHFDGSYLGTATPCNVDCGYNGSEDKLIITGSWNITQNPNGVATLSSQSDTGATVQISSSAKNEDVIIVQARSKRADDKGYGPVTGEWRIKIEAEDTNVFPLPGSGFRFGTDNDDRADASMTYNFIKGNLIDYSPGYIVCVRVRERGAAVSKYGDQVMVYRCSGENVRFAPDFFGLDLTDGKEYDMSMQLLVPVKMSVYGNDNPVNHQDKEDDGYTIADHYYNNVDAAGAYNGGVYWSSPLFTGIIAPPTISVEAYDGDGNMIEFPNDDNAYLSRNLLSDGEGLVISKIEFGATYNVREDQTLNKQGMVKFSIFKEGGNDYNGWSLVAGYDLNQSISDQAISNLEENPGKNNDVMKSESFGDGVFRIQNQQSSLSPLTSTNYLRQAVSSNNMSSDQLNNAAGTYYIMPGFWFRNKKPDEYRSGYTIYRTWNINGDYNWHFYKQPASAIKLVVKSDLNLNVITNSENWWTSFPAPSESQFPFDLKSPVKQTAIWNFTQYNASKQSIGSLYNVKVECEYKSDNNRYEITLLYESINGTTITTRNYGTYYYDYSENKWQCKTIGGVESSKEIKANLENFSPWSNGGDATAYFPTPSDSDFPFAKESTQDQTIQYSLIWFPSWGGSETATVNIKCSYNATDKKYTITIYNEWWSSELGTYTWSSGATNWTRS